MTREEIKKNRETYTNLSTLSRKMDSYDKRRNNQRFLCVSS
jgi:hypothetical protein